MPDNSKPASSYLLFMYRYLYFTGLIFTLGLFACNSGGPANSGNNVISVSILPQEYIVSQIAGDKFSINVLVPEEANHETYEPTAGQMVKTGNSKAYFKLGYLDFERSWLSKLSESNPGMKVIDTSEGIEMIEEDSHEHGDHMHGGGIDPHIWLSVSAVKIQADNILKGLTGIDPENSVYYRNNHSRFMVSLDSLDAAIRVIFDSIPARGFMIYHPSLGYFARDYNLEQIAIEQEGKEPSPAYMKELIDVAEAKNINTIFISSQFNKQSAVVIAGQTGAKVEEFNPLAPDWHNNMLKIAAQLAASTQTK